MKESTEGNRVGKPVEPERGVEAEAARKPWVAVAILWALLTLGAVPAARSLKLPRGFGREAEIADEAFRLLMYLGAPVFATVVAVMVVAVVAFRERREGEGQGGKRPDGAHLVASPRFDGAWLAITSALALVLIVNPGIVGIARFFGSGLSDEMVVRVEGARWFWTVTYPDAGVTTNSELVLPVGRRVRFEVTSKDILHSFWIPGLRVKIDAVPGRTTTISASATDPGGREDDEGLRLQCAELCGLAHSTMAIPVRLLPAAEFDSWLAEQAPSAGKAAAERSSCPPASDRVTLVAERVAFDAGCLTLHAGRPAVVVMTSKELVPHNFAVYETKGGRPLFVGETVTGPVTVEYALPPLPPGTYYFQCDLHPIEAMSGEVKVA